MGQVMQITVELSRDELVFLALREYREGRDARGEELALKLARFDEGDLFVHCDQATTPNGLYESKYAAEVLEVQVVGFPETAPDQLAIGITYWDRWNGTEDTCLQTDDLVKVIPTGLGGGTLYRREETQ